MADCFVYIYGTASPLKNKRKRVASQIVFALIWVETLQSQHLHLAIDGRFPHKNKWGTDMGEKICFWHISLKANCCFRSFGGTFSRGTTFCCMWWLFIFNTFYFFFYSKHCKTTREGLVVSLWALNHHVSILQNNKPTLKWHHEETLHCYVNKGPEMWRLGSRNKYESGTTNFLLLAFGRKTERKKK